MLTDVRRCIATVSAFADVYVGGAIRRLAIGGSGPKRPADAASTSIPPSSLTRVSRPETLAILTGNDSSQLCSQPTLTEAGYASTVMVTVFPPWEQCHRRRRPGSWEDAKTW